MRIMMGRHRRGGQSKGFGRVGYVGRVGWGLVGRIWIPGVRVDGMGGNLRLRLMPIWSPHVGPMSGSVRCSGTGMRCRSGRN